MFETVMTENFPQLMLDTKPQIQEAQRTPSVVNIFKNPQKTHIHLGTLFSNYRKSKIRKNIPKEARGKKSP